MINRVYKLRPDHEDQRDRIFRSLQFEKLTMLPKIVDLRSGCSPVVDQGALGSCTANAIASGLREYWENLSGDVALLSRLWLYWEERNMEGTVNEDAGAYIRDGMKILQKMGCASEADWPYDTTKFTQTPPENSTINATKFIITEYHRVTDLTSLKAALAEGYPVVIGIDVYARFESAEVAQTGLVPLPNYGEQLLGGHAVLAIGYKDVTENNDQGVVICRNSWSESWGDKGYFYLPYSYFTRYVTDMWTGK
ncbi:MAG TPA: C1 family peptidase [Desulfosporosinus sp.]|nr:C1 family peptidase [Desulfosporosinus sp.]